MENNFCRASLGLIALKLVRPLLLCGGLHDRPLISLFLKRAETMSTANTRDGKTEGLADKKLVDYLWCAFFAF